MRRLVAKIDFRPRARGSGRHRRAGALPRALARPLSSSERWCGNRPSSQPGRNTVSNSSPLAAVQRHDADRVAARRLVVRSITSETCSRKPCEVLELLQDAPVPSGFPAGRRLGRAFCPAATSRCSRIRRARFRPARVRHRVAAACASGRKRLEQRAQRGARLRLAARRSRSRRGGCGQRDVGACGRSCSRSLHGGVAEAARGRVDDALEGEIVGRLNCDARADRPARRGFRRARRSAGRRSRDRAGRA
jgi:hypothetical protein